MSLIHYIDDFVLSITDSGAYSDLGLAYYWMCDDGGLLCWVCVNEEKARIVEAMVSDCPDDMQWRVIGKWESSDTEGPFDCDNCGRTMEDGYADDPGIERAS